MGSLCCGLCDEEKQENNTQNNTSKAYKLSEQNSKQNVTQSDSQSNKTAEQLTTDTNTPLRGASNPTEYRTASREEVAAAAERRATEQKAKNQVKTLRQTNAELPSNTNSGGLRWQVG